MASFVRNDNNTSLPISVYDPNLELLLFSHLFSDGKDHFHDIKKQVSTDKNKSKTLGKYAKHMLLFIDLRFRLDHY